MVDNGFQVLGCGVSSASFRSVRGIKHAAAHPMSPNSDQLQFQPRVKSPRTQTRPTSRRTILYCSSNINNQQQQNTVTSQDYVSMLLLSYVVILYLSPFHLQRHSAAEHGGG